jgi:DNA polymerase
VSATPPNITNAVKHFRFRRRGKKRIHQKPSVGQIEQCRWWLARELSEVEPAVVVHPSYLLRLREGREQEFDRFAKDLRRAAGIAAERA